jgi:hypothetical protein
VNEAIKQADEEAAKLIGGIDGNILHYQEFGSEYLKRGMYTYIYINAMQLLKICNDV